jgi:hypothetical protein
MRKLVDTDSTLFKVNSVVLLIRVFFEKHQNSKTFHVQIVLNHHRDSIFALIPAYDAIINQLENTVDWSHPQEETSNTKITFFEKKFDDICLFLAEFDKMCSAVSEFGVVPDPMNPLPLQC